MRCVAQSVKLPGFVNNLDLSICVRCCFQDKPRVMELTRAINWLLKSNSVRDRGAKDC